MTVEFSCSCGKRFSVSDDKAGKKARCHELEVQIAEQKAAIKAERQFNRQLDLKTQIKTLEKQLKAESSRL